MNSEVNRAATVWDDPEQRESRQYVRMGREASPLLPWIGDVGAGEESVGDMNALFDFGFASAAGAVGEVRGGAQEEDGRSVQLTAFRSALDEIDLAIVERKLDGALAGFEPREEERVGSDDDLRTKDPVEEVDRSSRSWEHAGEFWKGREWAGFAAKDAGRMEDVTPKKRDLFEDESRRKSIQRTPKSLYDSDGFLNAT